jgi:hypothetical protein
MAPTSDFVAVLVRRKDKVAVLNISSTKLTMHAMIISLVVKLNFCAGFLATTAPVPSGVVCTFSPGIASDDLVYSFISTREFIVDL